MSGRSAGAVGYALVLLAATLWGTLGVWFRLLLQNLPLTPVSLAYVRAGLAFLVLGVALAVARPRLLRVRRADVPYLAAFGSVSVAAYYYLYVQAVALTTVAMAVVLLYTAPAWVALLAWRVYGEAPRRRTVVAMLVTLAGTGLVVGAFDVRVVQASLLGVLAGLGAGFTYALYSIFGKRAVLLRYSPWTVLLYVLGFGALSLLPAQAGLVPTGIDGVGWVALAGLAVVSTIAPLAAYTEGLRRMPASVASVLSTWEPAVAAVLGYVVLGEALSAVQLVGAGLILVGVVTLRAGSG